MNKLHPTDFDFIRRQGYMSPNARAAKETCLRIIDTFLRNRDLFYGEPIVIVIKQGRATTSFHKGTVDQLNCGFDAVVRHLTELGWEAKHTANYDRQGVWYPFISVTFTLMYE